MTSLQKQLERLKTPQTEQFRQQKYTASFLYDKKEASSIDCETHLRIARKGLKKLAKLNDELESYQHLFSDESKEIERAVLKQDENDELSRSLKKFIHAAILPYFMLNDCHVVLEYLIYKYQVHRYEPDDLICAILPYHETRIFARVIQIIEPPSHSSQPLWGWLDPYKKEALPIPKERILSVLSSKAKIPLVSLLGDKLIEMNKDTSKAGVYTSFYTTTIMCVLDKQLEEDFFVAFMPHVYKIIKKSTSTSLFMAGLVLIGYLGYTQNLDESYLTKIQLRLAKTHSKLRERQPKDCDLLDEYYAKVVTVIKNHQQH